MKTQKILALLLITSFFTANAELNPLADGVEMGDMKYNSDGSVQVGDTIAEENNLSTGDDISVTDEESRVGDMTAGGAEYTPTPEEGNTASSESSSSDSDPFAATTSSDSDDEAVVTSSTGNGNVEELPKTGPEELFILIFSLLIAGLFFSKRLKNV